MEFHEKLQILRKEKGLTQEELAAELFVSRAAISKWESGRGYPSIDSIKAIANYFSISIDALLSTSEALTIAEEDAVQEKFRLHDLIFGCLDCCFAVYFVLPIFGQSADGIIQNVTIFALTSLQPWLRAIFGINILAVLLLGILTFALQSCDCSIWAAQKRKFTLILNVCATFLFILCRQPYAASLALILLAIKVLVLSKSR